jgi:hypothetical protein
MRLVVHQDPAHTALMPDACGYDYSRPIAMAMPMNLISSSIQSIQHCSAAFCSRHMNLLMRLVVITSPWQVTYRHNGWVSVRMCLVHST